MSGYNTECIPQTTQMPIAAIRGQLHLQLTVIFACGRTVAYGYSHRFRPAENRRPCRRCARAAEVLPTLSWNRSTNASPTRTRNYPKTPPGRTVRGSHRAEARNQPRCEITRRKGWHHRPAGSPAIALDGPRGTSVGTEGGQPTPGMYRD